MLIWLLLFNARIKYFPQNFAFQFIQGDLDLWSCLLSLLFSCLSSYHHVSRLFSTLFHIFSMLSLSRSLFFTSTVPSSGKLCRYMHIPWPEAFPMHPVHPMHPACSLSPCDLQPSEYVLCPSQSTCLELIGPFFLKHVKFIFSSGK